MKKSIAVLLLISTLFSCGYVATTFTAKKKYSLAQSDFSKQANKYFWDNYHQGNYDSIPQITNMLNVALQENPNDIITTTHLGFLHVWALSERQRLETPKADITEQITLSRKYFDEANAMNKHDLRVLGFLADLTLAEGSTLNNKKQTTKGYFLGLKSIRKWPQFNKFTVGYFFSSLNKQDKNFKKGINWQYETIDDCACEKGTKNTDYKLAIDKIRNSKDPVINRACWNTWIAPHNWEGFCMNWGDMLIKSGEISEGIKIYELAKESNAYNQWPFKADLELRITNAKKNEVDFNNPINEQNLKTQNVIMFNSKMACTGCHQMSKSEFETYGYKELDKQYYFTKNNKNY